MRTRPASMVPAPDWLDADKRAEMPPGTIEATNEVVDSEHPAAATPRDESGNRWMGEDARAKLLKRAPDISPTVLVDMDAAIMRGVRISPGAQVQAGAQVRAYADIGTDADIGRDAVVRSSAQVGDDVKIGTGTVVEGDARIGEHATIGDDVRVAGGARVPPGAEIESRATVLAGEPWVIPPQPPAPTVQIERDQAGRR